MLIGTYEGKTIHCYHIGGKEYYVRRGRDFVAAWDKRTDVVIVLTPAGMSVQKVPANRLPEKFGFMVAHPSATVGPVKLEDYKIHTDTIYSSGAVVTDRICYDAFVLDNKKTGIYYQATT